MLKGKVALITGGTRGIGLETVKIFKDNHAEVILFGSKEESVNKALAQLDKENYKVTCYYPDLNDYE